MAPYAGLSFSSRSDTIVFAAWVRQSRGLSCLLFFALPLPARFPFALRPEFRSESGRDRGTGPPQLSQGFSSFGGRTCRHGITSGGCLGNRPMGRVSDVRLVRRTGVL